jgi:NAD(P)-dependent dehydrogenase (short-subunit alcohol dehydrogenase family)
MNSLDIFSLSGRVAIVWGGGGGIGSAMAQAMGGAGASVAVVDYAGESADTAAGQLRERGVESLALSADATKREDCERAIDAALARFGHIDISLNAIGGGAGRALHPAEDYPMSAWDWILDLNLRSTLCATQVAASAMIRAGNGGRIISISSVRGQLGINAGYSAYVAAKGAINALTRQWATEWAKHRITVNAIAPTFVDTPQVAMLLQDVEFTAKLVERIPLGRVARTDDLAGAVLFFASAASGYVTGQVLTIDGGLTATQ